MFRVWREQGQKSSQRKHVLNTLLVTLLIDTREPWPHPWSAFWSTDVRVVRGTLETGDMALAALPDGAVIERKTVADLLACLSWERARFERELQRGRYVGRLLIFS